MIALLIKKPMWQDNYKSPESINIDWSFITQPIEQSFFLQITTLKMLKKTSIQFFQNLEKNLDIVTWWNQPFKPTNFKFFYDVFPLEIKYAAKTNSITDIILDLNVIAIIFQFLFSFTMFFMLLTLLFTSRLTSSYTKSMCNFIHAKLVNFFDTEEELGSVEDFLIVLILFICLISWYFVIFLLYLSNKITTFYFATFSFFLISFFVLCLPTSTLTDFGISFANYIRGAGNSTSLIIEIIYDLLATSIIFIRFIVQNIRFVLIFAAYIELFEWVYNSQTSSYFFGSFDSKFSILSSNLTNIHGVYIFSILVFDLVLYFYYTLHLLFILILQLAAYFLISFWLFFFFYTSFFLTTHEKHFFYKKWNIKYERSFFVHKR